MVDEFDDIETELDDFDTESSDFNTESGDFDTESSDFNTESNSNVESVAADEEGINETESSNEETTVSSTLIVPSGTNTDIQIISHQLTEIYHVLLIIMFLIMYKWIHSIARNLLVSLFKGGRL